MRILEMPCSKRQRKAELLGNVFICRKPPVDLAGSLSYAVLKRRENHPVVSPKLLLRFQST